MPCAFHLDHHLRAGPGCQFPEDELIEVPGGQTWCRFHLPTTVDGAETPKARWSKAGVVAFNDAIFAFIDAAREEQRVADLSGVVFPRDISFARYQGEENRLPDVRFIATIFGDDVDFAKVGFGDHSDFEKTRFSGDADFSKASFGVGTYFVDASFEGGVDFDEASFGTYTDFQGVTFGEYASIEKVSFNGYALFINTKFLLVYFRNACFRDEADFREARFSDDADFSRAQESTDGNPDVIFHGVDCSRAKFSVEVRFHNRKFLGTTDFRDAYFEVAPKFHGCTLHQDTLFPPEANFRDRSGAEAALAYRTLKHAMASVHARGEEAKFSVLEQKSLLRDPDTPRTTKLFSVLYWLASDYGQSVLRPLLGLLVTALAFCLLYVGCLMYQLQPAPALDVLAGHWQDVLRFALQQMFQPFQVFRVGPAAPPGLGPDALHVVPLALALVAAVHSVITLSLLALFLLALRRRFKLD